MGRNCTFLASISKCIAGLVIRQIYSSYSPWVRCCNSHRGGTRSAEHDTHYETPRCMQNIVAAADVDRSHVTIGPDTKISRTFFAYESSLAFKLLCLCFFCRQSRAISYRHYEKFVCSMKNSSYRYIHKSQTTIPGLLTWSWLPAKPEINDTLTLSSNAIGLPQLLRTIWAKKKL